MRYSVDPLKKGHIDGDHKSEDDSNFQNRSLPLPCSPLTNQSSYQSNGRPIQMQVTQLGSNVTLERCEVQTVQNVTNVNCQYQNEDFKTDTGDKTGEYVVAQENCDLNRNNGGNGEEVNTKEVAQQITAELKRYSIPQAIFAQRVLCRSQVSNHFLPY